MTHDKDVMCHVYLNCTLQALFDAYQQTIRQLHHKQYIRLRSIIRDL